MGEPTAAPEPEPRRARLVSLLAAVSSLVVFALYVAPALALVRYPWDWSPDEGLHLDYARRLLKAPETLYPLELVPFPAAYTPLLPVVLAPVVALFEAPLGPARVVALAWTGLIAWAVFALARRRAPRPLGLGVAALALAPVDLSQYYMLVRVDGLMMALWLAAGVVLVPRRLERGADRLSWSRAWGGGLLLLGSVLAKPTAVLLGAPLVLGWLIVDRRSAIRLTTVVGGLGLLSLVALQALTSGGFLWTMGLWKTNPLFPRHIDLYLVYLLKKSAPILLFSALGILSAARVGARPWRDGTLLLFAGGVAVVPSIMKAAAGSNYLLPLLCAITVWGGRCWSDGPRRSLIGLPVEGVAAAVAAVLALSLSLIQTFPLPTVEDRATADAFYGFVRERGKPILATRPDYAYFLLGQPVEVEGTSLMFLHQAHVRGSEKVIDRLERRVYTLVVAGPRSFPPDPALLDAVDRNYRPVGGCELSFYYGRTYFGLFVPAGEPSGFTPPPGTRCHGVRSPPPTTPVPESG